MFDDDIITLAANTSGNGQYSITTTSECCTPVASDRDSKAIPSDERDRDFLTILIDYDDLTEDFVVSWKTKEDALEGHNLLVKALERAT